MAASFHSSGDFLADRRYQHARLLADGTDFAAAADLFAQALELAPDWAAGWFALGEARRSAGARDAAVAAYQRTQALDPADTFGAGVQLARLGAAPMPDALPQAYVRGLFDGYAPRFDRHLVAALNYRGPRLISAALKRACVMLKRPFEFARAVDLGCGTGLVGVELKGRVTELTGVDLSQAMLDEAAKTRCYGALHAGDMIEIFAREAGIFDLVIAADALVYVGDLAPFAEGCARALTPDGLAAFSLQSRAQAGFGLGADMRFSHSKDYVRRVLDTAGLAAVSLEPASTRQDRGVDVPGLICVARRGA